MPDIKEITTADFDALMGSEKPGAFHDSSLAPIGLFFLRDVDTIIGIDNSTSHAWVEEFKDLDICKRWLGGEDLEELRKEERR